MASQIPTRATPAEPKSSAAPRAVLALRLWTGVEESTPDPSFWKSDATAVWLINDVVAASQGVPVSTRGRIMIASFSGIHSAISAARRLQLAIQGFSEAEKIKGTAVSILIDSPEEPPNPASDDSFLRFLQKAAPAQILLTEKACECLGNLPVYSLRNSSQAGVREMMWQGPKGESSSTLDERSLTQLIEQHGVQDPAHEPEKLVAGDPESVAGVASEEGAEVADSRLPVPGLLGGKSRWLVGGACAAVLLVVIFGIIAMSHKNSSPAEKPIREAEPAATSNSVDKPSTPVQAPQSQPDRQTRQTARSNKENKALSKAAAQAQRESVKEKPAQETHVVAPAPPPPEPKIARGNCDLDQGELPDEIETAERSLARGSYKDAERQFGAVLGCEPGNGRARAGLDRVRKAIQARGSSAR